MLTVETFTTATQLQQTWIIKFARRIGLMWGSAKAIYIFKICRFTPYKPLTVDHISLTLPDSNDIQKERSSMQFR